MIPEMPAVQCVPPSALPAVGDDEAESTPPSTPHALLFLSPSRLRKPPRYAFMLLPVRENLNEALFDAHSGPFTPRIRILAAYFGKPPPQSRLNAARCRALGENTRREFPHGIS